MIIRYKFTSSILFGASCSALGSIIGGTAWELVNGSLFEVLGIYSLYMVLFFAVIGALFGIIMWAIPWGKFNSIELSTFNTLSIYKKIKWEEVNSTKILNLYVFKFILIYTPSSKWALWLPVNITKEHELRLCMAQSNNEVLKKYAKT